ncbi:methylmalonyl-CoA mutase family protein [Bacillus sp. 2205SS5-2]|uniref:methylmalonyl-CoA mutase family protein n=1 Tax=Bacillus sp. 2205SS5-2 TaxID=3109031 RepID=UPI003006126D
MADISAMKNHLFQQITYDEWEEKAEQTLKGKCLSTLNHHTYEQITLKPLYTKGDLASFTVDSMPGQGQQTRSFERNLKPWQVAQKVSGKDKEELYERTVDALSKGQTVLSFDTRALSTLSINELIELFLLLPTTEYPVNLIPSSLTSFAEVVANIKHQVTGVIAVDPLAKSLEGGKLWSSEEKQEWLRAVLNIDEQQPDLQTLLIDTSLYEASGATVVQQLSLALSSAVFYLDMLQQEGWSIEKIFSKLVFHFSVSSQFFLEISKIRAFRGLITTLCKAYDIPSQQVTISAETSSMNKSNLDEYVNILRAGNEAFAAVLAGVDYFTVSPFSNEPSQKDLATRLARNTQLILQDEVQLGKIIDPAGGSYYVEKLTHTLIDESWIIFQQIEKQGGLLEEIKTGTIQQEILAVYANRKHDLETRETTMIGTNIYPNSKDNNVMQPENLSLGSFSGESVTIIQRMVLSEVFEKLRNRGDKLSLSGQKLKAGIIGLSTLKNYKARADYVTGVLELGGIGSVWSEPCHQPADILRFIEESKLDYYCVCGKMEDYVEILLPSLTLLKDSSSITIDVAGLPEEKKFHIFKEAGISGSIHSKQNILEKLDELLKGWEAKR